MKRKVLKKMVAFASVAAILAGGTGCGAASSSTESQAVETNAETVSAEKKDTWLTDEMVTITYARPESSLQPYNPDCATVQWIRENLNIDLQVSTYADYETKMNTLLAANQLPDIFSMWGNPSDVINTGCLLELTDLIEQYCPNVQQDYENIPELSRYKMNGGIYTLAQIRRDENWEQGSVPCIRTDLLEEQGLEVPETWDELYDVLEKLAAAYPDSVAYGTRGDDRLLFNYMSPIKGLGGEYGLYQDEDGVWHMGCLEESYKEALQYINKMYVNGILDNEYLITSDDDWKSGLATGKYLFYYDNPVFLDTLNATLRETDPDAKLEPIMFLANEEGVTLNYGHPDNYYNVWGINADTENAEVLMKFIDWMYSEEGGYLMNYGVEGVHWEMVDGKPQFRQEIVDEYKSRTGDPTYEAGSEIGIGDLFMAMSWYSNYDAQFKETTEESWTRENIHKVYEDHMDYVIQQPIEPPYTAEESARITEINQSYMDYSKTEINKFVSGERSFDEWDDFVQELIDKGAQERVDIANQAEQRYQEENQG
ncbi:MAG TPA: extracellular solute-binding protein [Candidatus Eisenbergiella stercoravium]|nr:extracellular solute-binding protein [Candidatus Eisenbergiella stercoravium]